MDFVFNPYQNFKDNPGVKSALYALAFYRTLRDNPPSEIRQVFFPKTRAEIRAMTRSGPGVYRPVLKTDQGPGQFTAFKVEGDGEIPVIKKDGNEGYTVIEHHFKVQLDQLNGPTESAILREMDLVRDSYRLGDLNEAFLAVERLEMACEESGVKYRRKAGVGREGFFFIRPMKTEDQVVLPSTVAEQVEDIAVIQIDEFRKLAMEQLKRYSKIFGLEVDIHPEDINLPFYYHLDAQVFPNGEVVLDQIRLPDVGLFLTKLDPNGNETLYDIQSTIATLTTQIMDYVAASLLKHPNFSGKVLLVTRKAVIEEEEDTLEILELQVVQKELKERGIGSEIVSAEDTVGLNGVGLLFNVDPDSEEFKSLLEARIRNNDSLHLFPDPLLRAAESKMSGLKNTFLGSIDLENFHALVNEVDQNPERAYKQLLAIDGFLRSLEIEEDVLHFYIPGQPTPAPAFRGDLGSFHQISNMIKRVDGSVNVRQIPIDPKRAVLFDQNGGIYSVFRFTVLEGEI